jgi:Ion channel
MNLAWLANLLVIVVTAVTVALVVLLHYEGLVWLSGRLAKRAAHGRRKVLYGVYVVLCIHVVEIWLFGLAMWMLLAVPGTGHILGLEQASFLDAVYLSAATFTTVGFGDVSPGGAIRFLAGTEALTGFALITWSASFTFIEMEQYWRRR